jgi:hypothetical protein
MPEIEDTIETIQRRRVLFDLELTPEIQATMTVEQDAAIDSLREFCPLVDEPNLIAKIVDINRPAALALLQQLPATHPISRILEGRWPQ